LGQGKVEAKTRVEGLCLNAGAGALKGTDITGQAFYGPSIGSMVGHFPAVSLHMTDERWERLTAARLGGFAACLGVFLLVLFRSEPGFVFLLDYANLLFHEAGHPIVGLLSARLEPYGGTLGQLVFPVLLAVTFWKRGQVLGVAAGAIWFFENWFNIARYLADARAMELPLVGGGDHDWNTILSRWGLLQYDARIAAGLRIVAWAGIAASCVWVGWRAWRQWRGDVFVWSKQSLPDTSSDVESSGR
jgi:hypothetical protein